MSDLVSILVIVLFDFIAAFEIRIILRRNYISFVALLTCPDLASMNQYRT